MGVLTQRSRICIYIPLPPGKQTHKQFCIHRLTCVRLTQLFELKDNYICSTTMCLCYCYVTVHCQIQMFAVHICSFRANLDGMIFAYDFRVQLLQCMLLASGKDRIQLIILTF